MAELDVSDTLAEILAELTLLRKQVVEQQAKIAELEAHQIGLAVSGPRQAVKTSRRKMLKNLSLAGGLAILGNTLTSPSLQAATGQVSFRQPVNITNSPTSLLSNRLLHAANSTIDDTTIPFFLRVAVAGVTTGIDNTFSNGTYKMAFYGRVDQGGTQVDGIFLDSPFGAASGIYAECTNNGVGVRGYSGGNSGMGVCGSSPGGIGVYGEGENGGVGVYARCNAGIALRGNSSASYGAVLNGGKAPLRLVAASSGTGAPTSQGHQVGEFYVDSAGSLFYCSAVDTDGVGTWTKLAP